MTTTEQKHLSEISWLEFGKGLLKKYGASEQQQEEFLSACRSGKADFMKYIHDNLLSGNSVRDGGLVDIQHNFSEKEFLRPPESTQKVIWNTLQGQPYEQLYSCECWGYLIIRMIEAGRIEPSWLASNWNGSNDTGEAVIDDAMANPGKKGKKRDRCVRRILRSMCNPVPRGKRIVFNDFHLGKSFWRWHWADRMHQHIGLSLEQTLEVLDENNYGEFSAKMHSAKGQSYISAEKTLGGLLLFLAQEQGAKRMVVGKRLREIIDSIGYLSAWKAIETQDVKANQADIEQIAKSV